MADTGFLFPGTAASRDTSENVHWSNPDNIKADDGSDATVTLTFLQNSHGLAASNFDFSSIASGSTIDGIEVQLGDYRETSGVSLFVDTFLILADDSTGSEDKFPAMVTPTSSDNTDEAGGASDLWGETIGLSDVQDVDWGWFTAFGTENGTGMDVGFMKMKVHYTTSPPPPTPTYLRRMVGGFFG